MPSLKHERNSAVTALRQLYESLGDASPPGVVVSTRAQQLAQRTLIELGEYEDPDLDDDSPILESKQRSTERTDDELRELWRQLGGSLEPQIRGVIATIPEVKLLWFLRSDLIDLEAALPKVAATAKSVVSNLEKTA